MRPILVNIPSKLLFAAALVLAAAAFVRDLWRSRGASKPTIGSAPLYLGGAALALYVARSGEWKPLPIYAYGVMLGSSLVVGWFLAMRLAKEDGVPEQDAGTIYMWTAVWSIIGSRLLWFFPELFAGRAGFFDLFLVWQGGLVAYGGMIGGFLASWYGCRKRGIELLRWADVSAPSVVLGTGITRVGCLLFGCDYGAPTDLPWALHFPGPNPDAVKHIFPSGGVNGSPAWQHHLELHKITATAATSLGVHPTQVYESLAGIFLFLLLMFIRRHRRFSGQVFLGWVFGYGILRPLIETVRDDEDRGVYFRDLFSKGLSTSQIIGIVSVVLGVGLLVALVRKYRQDPEGSRLWLLPLRVPATAGGPAGDAAPGAAKAGGNKRRKRR
jgi:phosphatidylglycerol:prolipoprotein diacylglycerol transferase